MKHLAMTRPLDQVGRIVLPKETRSIMKIKHNTPLEIFTDGDLIILKKLNMNCEICDGKTDLKSFKGKKICRVCSDYVKYSK